MDDRVLLQQALEALELLAWCENPATRVQVRKPRNGGSIVTVYPHKVATDAAAPLRERLAQPEQKPVAWMYTSHWKGDERFITRYQSELTAYKADKVWPLYTTPPQRKPQYNKTEMNCFVQNLYDQKMREGKHGHYETMFHVVHRAIEAAHGIKENT